MMVVLVSWIQLLRRMSGRLRRQVMMWLRASVTEGWEATPPVSPIEEAWPGAIMDECCGAWPFSAEVVQAHCDVWPGFPADVEGGIEVTVEVCSSVGEIQGEHSTCRSS
jgi:hypothetical protein